MSGDRPVMAFSPGGAQLAAAFSNAGRVRWLVHGLAASRSLDEQPGEATALAFSPDGALLAVGLADGTVTLRDTRSWRVVSNLGKSARRTTVTSLAFGRDYLLPVVDTNAQPRWLLAVGYEGAQVIVWDIARDEQRATLRGSQYGVSGLAFSPDGAMLASGGRYAVRLWDVATERLLLALPGHAEDGTNGVPTVEYVGGLAFSPDGTRLGIAGGRTISLWELNLHRGLRALRGLATQVDYAWISPKSRWVAGVSHDWQLGVWAMGNGQLQAVWQMPQGLSPDNAGCAFDAEEKTLAFGAGTNAVRFDLAAKRAVTQWSLSSGLSDSMAHDAKGRLLLLRREARDGDPILRAWVLRHLQGDGSAPIVHEQENTNWGSYVMRLSPDGRFGAVLGYERAVPAAKRIYSLKGIDIESGRDDVWPARETFGQHEPVFDTMGLQVAYARGPNDLELVSVPQGQPIRAIHALRAFTTSRKWVARTDSGRGLTGNVLFDGTNPGRRRHRPRNRLAQRRTAHFQPRRAIPCLGHGGRGGAGGGYRDGSEQAGRIAAAGEMSRSMRTLHRLLG
jgi:WD40 repeat protein